jgi:hypothetical protein
VPHARAPPGVEPAGLLDVGCGSGVLIAAAKLASRLSSQWTWTIAVGVTLDNAAERRRDCGAHGECAHGRAATGGFGRRANVSLDVVELLLPRSAPVGGRPAISTASGQTSTVAVA